MEIQNSWEKTDVESDRNGFIRKVYGILSVQLLVTAAAITWVKTDPALNA
jgi:FtsH-binding integral membrane protein